MKMQLETTIKYNTTRLNADRNMKSIEIETK